MDVPDTETQELHEMKPRGTLVVNLGRNKWLQKNRKAVYRASLFHVSNYVQWFILTINLNLINFSLLERQTSKKGKNNFASKFLFCYFVKYEIWRVLF